MFFYTNGDTAELDTYSSEGLRNGRWETWYENGKLSTITPYSKRS